MRRQCSRTSASAVIALLAALLGASLFSSGCKDEPSTDARSSQVPAKSSASTAGSSATTGNPAASTSTAPLGPAAAAAASAAASAVASAAQGAAAVASASSGAAAVADAPVDCDALLEPADVAAVCGKLVAAAEDQPTDDIGKERTCSRRFSSKEAGTLSMLVVRHESEAVAKERFKDINLVEGNQVERNQVELKVLVGIGDLARKYVKKGASGDPIWNAEAIKGRISLVVFNGKVSLGPTTVGPVCNEEELEKLLARVVKRLP